MFYRNGFHQFVAMSLYLSFAAGKAYAAHILEKFQLLMKEADPARLADLYPPTGFATDETDPLTHMLTFALCHRERIEKELKSLMQMQTYPGWALELSATAVYCLLAGWAEEHASLRVYCDDSKPIAHSMDLFNQLVGRQDKAYMPFGPHKGRSLLYNLSKPIQMVNSKEFSGVQIADVWATSLAYAYRHREDETCQRWLDIAADSIDTALFPDAELLNLDRERPTLNWMLLLELSRRSVVGEPIMQEIDEFLCAARSVYRTDSENVLID